MLKRLALAALLLFAASIPARAAFDFGDIICETTTTTGTGTVNLGGAVSNYATFVSQIASGSTVNYHIRDAGGKLETGVGTFTDATPDTLSRTAFWSSDGDGAELTLTAGTHTVCMGLTTQTFAGMKGFQLYNADAGAVGGVLPFWHDSSSAADGDIAADIQVFAGADDEQVGSIALEVDDGATTTEDTRWRHTVRVAGADVEVLTVTSPITFTANFVPGADATYDIGTSTVGVNDIHFGSGGEINFDGSDVTLTHAANLLTLSGGDLVIADGFGQIIGHGSQVTFVTDADGDDISEFQILGTASTDTDFAVGRFSANSSGPKMLFGKSRNATVGSHTIVQDGDDLGIFIGEGSNGTDFDPAASIYFEVDGTPGAATDMPGRIVLGTSPDGSKTITSRLTIKNDGRLIANTSGQVAHYWVYWTANSTTILASHNVTSIDDDATGDAGINITTAFSSNNYAAFVNTNDTTNGWDNEEVQASGINVHTTATVDVLCATITDGTTAATSLTDPDQWQSVGFGVSS